MKMSIGLPGMSRIRKKVSDTASQIVMTALAARRRTKARVLWLNGRGGTVATGAAGAVGAVGVELIFRHTPAGSRSA